MAYNSIELITNAFYLSGVVARGVEDVSGIQLSDGLKLLNDIISLLNIDERFVPYYKKYEFNVVIGQEEYFIPNLLDPETFTYFIDGVEKKVRFPTVQLGRKEYFGTARVEINSLLVTWHYERSLGGSTVYLYFAPNSAYPCTIFGKFGYDLVGENTDLSLIFDRFFTVYLEYELASFICSSYGTTLKPETLMQLNIIKASVKDLSPPDLSMVKMSNQTGQYCINYGYVNIAR